MASYVWIASLVVLPPLVLLYKVATRPERSRAARVAPRVMTGLPQPKSPEQLREDLFWFELLSPLFELHGTPLEQALSRMAGRMHQHPTDGRRTFDTALLRQQLARVRRMNPATLFAYSAEKSRAARPAREMSVTDAV